MKVLVSLIALFSLVSCGKKFEDRAQETTHKNRKITNSSEETWIIHSERPLPSKIKVYVNDMIFVNECTGLGKNADIVRNYNNGSISIPTWSAFRQEYFDVDIFDCRDGSEFFSADYVDQSPIVNPDGSPTIIVLRLKND
jgi:hypothetical protein